MKELGPFFADQSEPMGGDVWEGRGGGPPPNPGGRGWYRGRGFRRDYPPRPWMVRFDSTFWLSMRRWLQLFGIGFFKKNWVLNYFIFCL